MSTSTPAPATGRCQIGLMIADSARVGLGYAERFLTGVTADKFARLASVGGQTVISNHPAFIYGHLSLYPCRIVADLGMDAASIVPSDAFLQRFDHTAECVDDPTGAIYPSMDEITERFFTSHRLAIDALQSADDSLFTATNSNEAMRAKFATTGSMHGFYLGGHVMMHMGQMSAWRRMIGLGKA
jgi:hypothetical protein